VSSAKKALGIIFVGTADSGVRTARSTTVMVANYVETGGGRLGNIAIPAMCVTRLTIIRLMCAPRISWRRRARSVGSICSTPEGRSLLCHVVIRSMKTA